MRSVSGYGMFGLIAGLLLTSNSLAQQLPQRWVSAGGALSEWVVALGGASHLVGVDSTSRHLPALQALPVVGYQRQLAAEGILALRPDLLLGSAEMGPPPVLAQLQAAGVRVETLSAAAELSAVRDTVQRLGQLLGQPAQAQQVLARFERQLEAQQRWLTHAQQAQPAPGVLLVFGQGGSNPLVAGIDTSADWILRQAGGRNLATHSGYKALSAEALLALDPQVLVLADRRLRGLPAQHALLQHNPALASTQAGRQGQLLNLDPSLLVGGLGPRLPEALAALSAGFYAAATPLTLDSAP